MQKIKFTSIWSRGWILESVGQLLALAILAGILLNRSPNFLRPLSMNVRFGFTWIVPFLFIVLYLAFRLKGRLGQWIGLTVTLSVFALALAGMWASGHTQSTVISGLIPLFDAQVYYIDALRLLVGKSLSEFSTARPLFAGLLATILAVTGRNLMIAIGVLTAINGLAGYYAAREIQRTHGSAAAAFILLFILLYYRHRTVGTVMSENLGLPLGILGATLIWRGISKNSSRLVLYGLLTSTVSLNARPGPFFVLPALLLWGSWFFREPEKTFSRQFLIQGTIAIAAGFVLNLVVIRLIGTSAGTPFSQFSYAFYGLASGGNSFSYVFKVHPEVNGLLEPERSQTIYRLAFELIRDRPALLVQGAFHNWSMAFSNSGYSIYSYISGENPLVNAAARWGMYLLCVLGIIKWIRNADPHAGFIAAAFLGIIVSVPFVPPADAYGLRLYAASAIVLGLLPMLGLVFALDNLRLKALSQPMDSGADSRIPIWFSGVLLLLLLAGPLMVRGIDAAPEITAGSCQSKTSIVIRYDPGTSIRLIRERDLALDWMPVFHQSLFQRNAHGLPDNYLAEWFETIAQLQTIFYALDFQTNGPALVIIPTTMLPQPGTVMELCGEWADDPQLSLYSIFIANSARSISN